MPIEKYRGRPADAWACNSGSRVEPNDPCLARIAAVHLRIPDLTDRSARDDLEARDILIKFAGADPYEIHKTSPDDPKHPGWPAGTPGGRGGKFSPKDGSGATLSLETWNRITRDALRIGLVAALHIGIETLANFIPGIDIAAYVAMAADIARKSAEVTKLAVDAVAALDFVKEGPHSLEDLEVSADNYEEFSTYGQFVKRRTKLGPDNQAVGECGCRKSIPSHRHAGRCETRTRSRPSSCRRLKTLSFSQRCCTRRSVMNT